MKLVHGALENGLSVTFPAGTSGNFKHNALIQFEYKKESSNGPTA